MSLYAKTHIKQMTISDFEGIITQIERIKLENPEYINLENLEYIGRKGYCYDKEISEAAEILKENSSIKTLNFNSSLKTREQKTKESAGKRF